MKDAGKYRPWLERDDETPGTCVFVMLNPSTADDVKDDPTIRRCKSFAQREKCGNLVVVNLFTGRATKPTDLYNMDDPVGPRADDALERAARRLRSDEPMRIIFAWGATCHGPEWFRNLHNMRREKTISAFENYTRIQCLGLTKDKSPRHPLYVRGDAKLVRFPIEQVRI